MTAATLELPRAAPRPGGNELDYARALLNILEDSASEQAHLRDAQSAVLNILEDSAAEKEPFRNSQRAVLNILEDFSEEKSRLEEMKTAVLNILEDLAVEKERLEETQKEVLRSEEAIRSSLREKETLLKEIHHRVKNNLQVIVSLLRLQARNLEDPKAREMFEESQNRVYSISLVHEMLYGAGDLARIDFCDYLLTLTKGLTDGWKGTGLSVDIVVDAEGVQLGVDTAIPCGLIVTELVTNALKHAFPNSASGSIRVAAVAKPEGWLKLTVEDDGVGLKEGLELHRSGSLGLKLVDSLVRQLNATIEIGRNRGASFTILFQLPK
ncbi:MAG TPA: histidine kinase dimerization/phosphoacceptor domain -containing protein [Bryobacteraceae bacterium]|nr:histidine kinase dimerization/phosphoacceptor domain -containing protein [Bryobacteraceae bacterium]